MKELTAHQMEDYILTEKCGICFENFSDNNDKVQDHDHLTGDFWFAVQNSCNLKYSSPNYIPVVCHNLSRYDAHFIVKELAYDTSNIELLSLNKERYISFSKYITLNNNNYVKLRFIDSFKFMNQSLDQLSKNLESEQFVNVKHHFSSPIQMKLISQKGVFHIATLIHLIV